MTAGGGAGNNRSAWGYTYKRKSVQMTSEQEMLAGFFRKAEEGRKRRAWAGWFLAALVGAFLSQVVTELAVREREAKTVESFELAKKRIHDQLDACRVSQ